MTDRWGLALRAQMAHVSEVAKAIQSKWMTAAVIREMIVPIAQCPTWMIPPPVAQTKSW